MRRFISNILFYGILIGLAFYFREPILRAWNILYVRTFPCQQPIAYSIGTFDAQFGISKEAFLKDIQQAESIWEQSIEKQLFVYEPDGALKINLIYDDRQSATQKLQKLGLTISDSETSYHTLKTRLDALKKNVAQLKSAYQSQLNAYEARLTTYTKEVQYWNKQNHVTKDVVDRLTQEKMILDQLFAQLKESQNKVNANVDESNALVEVVNRIARSLNKTAVEYNTIGASRGEEFEEGTYVSDSSGNRIDIYQFDDQDKLIRVLTHEMGHAIGLEHVENEKAIMYRLNNGVNAELTEDDLALLKKQCGIK